MTFCPWACVDSSSRTVAHTAHISASVAAACPCMPLLHRMCLYMICRGECNDCGPAASAGRISWLDLGPTARYVTQPGVVACACMHVCRMHAGGWRLYLVLYCDLSFGLSSQMWQFVCGCCSNCWAPYPDTALLCAPNALRWQPDITGVSL